MSNKMTHDVEAFVMAWQLPTVSRKKCLIEKTKVQGNNKCSVW